jgi:hypothetical protein
MRCGRKIGCPKRVLTLALNALRRLDRFGRFSLEIAVIPFQIYRRVPLLRRPFYQRDQAIAERDCAIAELNALRAERQTPEMTDRTYWWRHRSGKRTAGATGVTGPSTSDDALLVARIIAAYRTANATALGDQGSVWLPSLKYPIHDTLMRREAETIVAPMLRDPGSNMLFYGFDNLSSGTRDPNAIWDDSHHVRVYDDLLRLAEAVGTQRLEYPEGPETRPAPDPEVILRDLDTAFGFNVHFPNPYPDEVGLKTSRGVASYRAVQGLYQAYRVAELVRARPDARVVEIGVGLGRTAFYAQQFGLHDYTLIDLPMTNVAQGYFLGRALGPDAISLFGEDRSGIRILPPVAFLEAADRYDLVVNVDALPELATDTATAYCQAIKARADIFLSINHEYSTLTVREICAGLGMRAESRMPYWLRRGYVDEVFRF